MRSTALRVIVFTFVLALVRQAGRHEALAQYSRHTPNCRSSAQDSALHRRRQSGEENYVRSDKGYGGHRRDH